MVLQGGSPFCRLPSKVKATKARSFARMELVSRWFILLFSPLMEGCVYATKIGLRPFGQFNVHFAHSRFVLSARYTLETRGNERSFTTKVSRRGQGLNLWRCKTEKGLMSSRCGEKERKTRNRQKPVCLLLRLVCRNRVGEKEQSKTR